MHWRLKTFSSTWNYQRTVRSVVDQLRPHNQLQRCIPQTNNEAAEASTTHNDSKPTTEYTSERASNSRSHWHRLGNVVGKRLTKAEAESKLNATERRRFAACSAAARSEHHESSGEERELEPPVKSLISSNKWVSSEILRTRSVQSFLKRSPPPPPPAAAGAEVLWLPLVPLEIRTISWTSSSSSAVGFPATLPAIVPKLWSSLSLSSSLSFWRFSLYLKVCDLCKAVP